MRVERRRRLPRPPAWAAILVAGWSLVVVAMIVANYASDAGLSACMLKNTTGGIPCPTCGGTRTVFHTLDGNLHAAFLQNPLVFVSLIVFGGWLVMTYLFRRRIAFNASRGVKRSLLIALALVGLINWAYVIVIDGPWSNPVKTTVAQLQEQHP